MTRVQKSILEVLRNSNQHLSAEQVFWQVRQQIPTVALGTIYRNLNRFADSGQIRRVARADSADYFEGNISPHDHAICTCCGEMVDLKIPGLKDFLSAQTNCKIISFDLAISYICPNCEEKRSDPCSKCGEKTGDPCPKQGEKISEPGEKL